MTRIAVAIAILLLVPASAYAAVHHEMRSCVVEVVHSEELPIAPLFYHTVKATLLVTAPGAAPFETTVLQVIPWQTPPPRRGQRMRVGCNRAVPGSNFELF